MDLTKKKNRKKLGKKALKFILKYGEKVLVKHGEKIVSALLSGAAGGVAMATTAASIRGGIGRPGPSIGPVFPT